MVASVGDSFEVHVSGGASVIISVGSCGGTDVIGFSPLSGWRLSIVASVTGIGGSVVVAKGIAGSSVIIVSVGARAGSPGGGTSALGFSGPTFPLTFG